MGLETSPNNSESAGESLASQLERAQGQKLELLKKEDSAQKEGMLRALNDIIANLQEQVGTDIDAAVTEQALSPLEEDPFSAAVSGSRDGRIAKRVEEWRDSQKK